MYVSTRGLSHRGWFAASLHATSVGGEHETPLVESDSAITLSAAMWGAPALESLREGGIAAINAIHLDRIPEFDCDRLL